MLHLVPKGAHVVLITPPPINTYQREADLSSRNPPVDLDRRFDVTQQYAEAVKEVGESNRVPVADVWTALWNKANHDEKALAEFLTDGLHLNTAGYEVRISFPL
jgi:isoamyl acetate esterase